MTPEEVRETMEKAALLETAAAARIINDGIHSDDQHKLSLAVKEVGGWDELQDGLHLFYEMLENPKPEIMEGDEVQSETASLCIAMVIGVRARGLQCELSRKGLN